MFTSGTAGFPKAAMLTHGNLRSNIEQMQANEARAQTGRRRQPRRAAAVAHLRAQRRARGFPVRGVARSCSSSASIRRLRSKPCSATVSRSFRARPAMWTAWASLADVADDAFASVRIAASGAAKLPLEVGETLQAPVRRRDHRGLRAHRSLAGRDDVGRRAGEARVRSARRCPACGCASSTAKATTCWSATPARSGLPARTCSRATGTTRRRRPPALTDDGWLRTGDVAVVDDDGQLFLVDRVKDLIIVSGFNVFPAEVEVGAARTSRRSQACGVIGVSHPYTGEAVKAYVVVAPGRSVEEDELIAFCAERLARYKCPEKIMFVDEIPLGSTGKVLRRTLT